MSDPIISVDGLEKRYGGVVAVDELDLDIEEGSITGLIGPNGAGKTTTFDLLSGFEQPDGGQVRYDGHDLQKLMVPSRAEQLIWGGATVLITAALGAIVALGPLGLGPALGAAALGVGALLGLVAFRGQARVRQQRAEMANQRPQLLAREGLVRTFQITRELTEMTTLENLMLAPMNQAGENLFNTWFRGEAVAREEAAIEAEAEEMLELLEIDHLRDEQAGNLSGGQRKLLELGRALMLDPTVILLDEPVAGVNPTLTRKLIDRIEVLRERGYTFCIVEHDMEVIMSLSDRIIVMAEGRRLTEGPPAEIRADEAVIEAYLGDA
jgi:branched-chain amino acid transport system ATP-binding protein